MTEHVDEWKNAEPSPALLDAVRKAVPKEDFLVVDSLKITEPEEKDVPDPDRLLMQAKQLVVDNYNANRNAEKTAALTRGSVYIVWFCKTLGNWKAIVASPVARGLMWEVTYNGHRGEAYIDVYKKITNVRVPTGGIHA
jgi:hypothetical protein